MSHGKSIFVYGRTLCTVLAGMAIKISFHNWTCFTACLCLPLLWTKLDKRTSTAMLVVPYMVNSSDMHLYSTPLSAPSFAQIWSQVINHRTVLSNRVVTCRRESSTCHIKYHFLNNYPWSPKNCKTSTFIYVLFIYFIVILEVIYIFSLTQYPGQSCCGSVMDTRNNMYVMGILMGNMPFIYRCVFFPRCTIQYQAP